MIIIFMEKPASAYELQLGFQFNILTQILTFFFRHDNPVKVCPLVPYSVLASQLTKALRSHPEYNDPTQF